MKSCVVVLSGGMDSSTLLHYVKKELDYTEIYALTFQYGQRHNQEIEMAVYQAKDVGVTDHVIIDISFLGKLVKDVSALSKDSEIKVPHIKEVLGDPQPVTYVPNRNMILLAIAISYAETVGCNNVFYGAQKHDEYSGYFDATSEFVSRLNHVNQLNRRHSIHINTPFVNWSKADIAEWGLSANVDYSHTLTCYNGVNPACGKCPTCADRIQAFRKINEKDPLPYAIEIDWGI